MEECTVQQIFTSLKKKMCNIFWVNNKYTRTTTVDFEPVNVCQVGLFKEDAVQKNLVLTDLLYAVQDKSTVIGKVAHQIFL